MARSKPRPDEDAEPLAAETMVGDLRDFILDRLKHEHNPLPWNMRPEGEQREVVNRVETAVRHQVHRAVTMIASEGRPAARATLVKLQFKDGLQMQVNCAASEPLRHDLADSVGGSVLLVLAGIERFSGERAPAKVTPDQGGLLDQAAD